jgi:hypothetical protein
MVENDLMCILRSNIEPDLDKIHDGDLMHEFNSDSQLIVSYRLSILEEKITQK